MVDHPLQPFVRFAPNIIPLAISDKVPAEVWKNGNLLIDSGTRNGCASKM